MKIALFIIGLIIALWIVAKITWAILPFIIAIAIIYWFIKEFS